MCNSSTCGRKSSNYVGLLQRLADRPAAESTAVQRAQEGGGDTAEVVCRLVFSHRAVRQHGHVQLAGLQAVEHLQETEERQSDVVSVGNDEVGSIFAGIM